jgi:hypothetical protein
MLHVPCALLPSACCQRQRACCALHALGGTLMHGRCCMPDDVRCMLHVACRTASVAQRRAQCPLRRCALHAARRRPARAAAHSLRCVAWLHATQRVVALLRTPARAVVPLCVHPRYCAACARPSAATPRSARLRFPSHLSPRSIVQHATCNMPSGNAQPTTLRMQRATRSALLHATRTVACCTLYAARAVSRVLRGVCGALQHAPTLTRNGATHHVACCNR